MLRPSTLRLFVLPCLVAAGLAEEARPGIERLLPKDGIPSISDPEFVAAGDAQLGEDSPVIGVSGGEEARCYSIHLLNHHELVNDTIGDQPIAVTW